MSTISAWKTPLTLRDGGPSAPGDAELIEIEPVSTIHARPPQFVVDLSEGGVAWQQRGLTPPLHGRYVVTARDVLLFGANHFITRDSTWYCEGLANKFNSIRHYLSQGFSHFYPGPRASFHVEGSLAILLSYPHAEVRYIDHPVFVATPTEPDNWGRWILYVLPKISVWKQYFPHSKFMCRAGLPWQRSLLALLGVDDDQLIVHNPGAIYVCREASAACYTALDLTVTRQERYVFAEIVNRFSNTTARKRIFVGRREATRRAPHYRVLLNEEDIQAKFASLGYLPIDPELMSFQEQVGIFAGADIVVGLGGAGMFNAAFCRDNARIASIESSAAFAPGHSRMFGSLVLEHGFVFGRQQPDDPAPVHKCWTVNIDKLLQTVSDLGFV